LSKDDINASSDNTIAESSENNSREEKTAKKALSDSDFAAKLLKFAENNPEALTFVEQIKDEIKTNSGLEQLDDGFQIAYRLVQEKQKYSPAELMASQQFVEDFIMTNEEVKNKVIDNYIKSLASEKKTPKLISGENTFSALAGNTEIASLADANKIFKKMLEN